MAIDPRTPVLVGAAVASQREADPARALEPAALMALALRRAADAAGAGDLLARADRVLVPRGFWDYADPGRLVAAAVGASQAKTLLAEIGVLQTSLFGHAARAIASGEAEIVLVTGGEAKYRALRASRAGVAAPLTLQGEVAPDEVLRPTADILHPLELARGLGAPVRQYAAMETALRFAEGRTVASHRRHVAELWAGMSRVAAGNPDAWNREPVDAATIAEASAANPMLAFPYTKLENSQWNVDQAAGLVFCSIARARSLRIPEARWVYLRSVAESNHMVPLAARRRLHRSPGFAAAGRRALECAGLALEEIAHVELYSCFPAAVRIQALELGLSENRPLTVTGGMTFAGGPLNNFVLQAAVKLAERLRAEGGHGLLDAVSGLMTKQGVSLWSAEPGDGAFAFEDVSAEAARETETVELQDEFEGTGRVAGYTVVYGRQGPESGVAYCDLEDGSRTIATSTDPDWLREMERTELCGIAVRIRRDGSMRPG